MDSETVRLCDRHYKRGFERGVIVALKFTALASLAAWAIIGVVKWIT